MTRKLLALNTYHYHRGGSEAVFFDHNALFKGIDWETAVFAMKHPENEPSPWSSYFIEELEFGNAYTVLDKLQMATKVIYSWEARSRLGKLLEKFHPDIAHGHLLYHHLSPSVLALLHQKGIPTVMTAHDLKLACPSYTMFNRTGVCEKCINGNVLHVIKNRCVRGSLATSSLVALESGIHKLLGLWRNNLDRIVTPSNFYRDKLIEWGWSADKIVYIPNYIDSSLYEPCPEPGDYFLYFGRLTEQKGVSTLIEAARKSKSRVLIAGTGPEENVLKAMTSADKDRVEFLGYYSGDRLRQLIREARAIVLPSVGYENAPISVLEAYASGKPVIGARIGGIPELIRDGKTGLLFTSGDSDGIAQCLELFEAMADDEIRDMGLQARQFVEETFTSQRYLASMLDLYESLV